MTLSPTVRHLTRADLEAGVDGIRQSPADHGRVAAVVVRPSVNERLDLDECELSPERGVHGDQWANDCWLKLPDGTPHPDVQVAIMNARCIALLAVTRERWSLAGDNLFVDLDLSADNLPAGQRLAIGGTILEITSQAHNGCRKFLERYGQDAVSFVNSAVGRQLHLRGVYARVMQGGSVRVGNMITKVRS